MHIIWREDHSCFSNYTAAFALRWIWRATNLLLQPYNLPDLRCGIDTSTYKCRCKFTTFPRSPEKHQYRKLSRGQDVNALQEQDNRKFNVEVQTIVIIRTSTWNGEFKSVIQPIMCCIVLKNWAEKTSVIANFFTLWTQVFDFRCLWTMATTKQ